MSVEFAIRGVRDQRAMGHGDPRSSILSLENTSKELQETGGHLRAMHFRFFHAKDKDDARDVLESLVSFVDSLAVTASRHLSTGR